MSSRERLFLLIFFISSFFTKISHSHEYETSSSTKLELIHRHDLHPNGRHPSTQLDRLRQLLHSDMIRASAASPMWRRQKQGRLNAVRRQVREAAPIYYPDCTDGTARRNKTHKFSGEMSMHSGADYGSGQYFVHFKVGSPAQRVVLIADTGSDLTWMNCRYRCRGARCRRNVMNKRRIFRADRSSSFRTVPCSSRTCKIDLANLFSLTRCPSPSEPCAYDYRYSDGSIAQGVFANETVTFTLTNGMKTKLHNVLVGCSEFSRGPTLVAVDGIMGLGYSNHSFAVKAANRFENKFSYCLVDHLSPKNISSYLIFGSHKENISRMQYTKLVLGAIPPFYAVNIRGISIGDSLLPIPLEVWNVNGVGGVIVDSGSSLTFLAKPAYQPVMAALRLSLSNFRKSNLDIGPLEYCFNSTGFDESLVPRLVFHFEDGARFEPPVKSYVIDAAVGVKCLGFVSSAWPGTSVIGNIMQQNHLWEFDIGNRRLGFARSSCNV